MLRPAAQRACGVFPTGGPVWRPVRGNWLRCNHPGIQAPAAGVIHAADSATSDCQPNDNVEALRVGLDAMNIESRPVWKPMHKQPVY